jgi:hypothetical protein
LDGDLQARGFAYSTIVSILYIGWSRTMPTLPFFMADVSTDTHFGVNPLAVVMHALAHDGPTMQAAVAEFNLSETTFVLLPADPANIARVNYASAPTDASYLRRRVAECHFLARNRSADRRCECPLIGGDRMWSIFISKRLTGRLPAKQVDQEIAD